MANDYPFTIKLDEDNLKRLMSEAILAQLSESDRQSILSQAIAYLMTPDKGSAYRPPRTPLQEAFECAVHQAAYDIAKQIFDEMPEVRAKVTEIITAAYERALVERREETISSLATSIVAAMTCHN